MKMEPAAVVMARGPEYEGFDTSKVDKIERRPGDGMEASTIEPADSSPSPKDLPELTANDSKHSKEQIPPKPIRNIEKIANKLQVVEKLEKITKSDVLSSYSMDDLCVTSFVDESSKIDYLNLSFVTDTLKRKLAISEEHNKQLIEEKMKLSHQLGIQTQVNNELKNLLVASIGDDLEQKYQRLIHDKHLADLELKNLHDTLEEDKETSENALIQADIWRSKFLASKLMTDELSHWKTVLYYKYRETHTALQGLLEEHSKIRALNQATNKNLINIVELLQSKDPSLDMNIKGLSTVDVAYMLNDLSESIYELISQPKEKEITIQCNKNPLTYDNDDKQLTSAESLAQEAVLDTNIQTKKFDHHSHNRISHFLSTNYQVTVNCCENCKGPLQRI